MLWDYTFFVGIEFILLPNYEPFFITIWTFIFDLCIYIFFCIVTDYFALFVRFHICLWIVILLRLLFLLHTGKDKLTLRMHIYHPMRIIPWCHVIHRIGKLLFLSSLFLQFYLSNNNITFQKKIIEITREYHLRKSTFRLTDFWKQHFTYFSIIQTYLIYWCYFPSTYIDERNCIETSEAINEVVVLGCCREVICPSFHPL